MAYIKYSIHLLNEWMINNNYEILIERLYYGMEEYADIHGSYDGFVSHKNGIEAFLIINNLRKMYWMRRIRIEDDRRPSTVNYYPRLAPIGREMQWSLIIAYENVDNDVSTDDEDNDVDDVVMREYDENWAAEVDEGSEGSFDIGTCMLYYDDNDDDIFNIFIDHR
ncbi:hypothetical protein PV327_011362 [Microctonus hyperodae]|uniref:Uncharacterized protein n=1 Tax=Microctonus hyperodae TaxID=165561 RepID=A0AA39KRR4_MICHY|nr:hypothetical protein PV327_011362 [Microctonus hyperodae]